MVDSKSQSVRMRLCVICDYFYHNWTYLEIECDELESARNNKEESVFDKEL